MVDKGIRSTLILGELNLISLFDLFYERDKVFELLLFFHNSAAYAALHATAFSDAARIVLDSIGECPVKVGVDRSHSRAFFTIPPLPKSQITKMKRVFSIQQYGGETELFCAPMPMKESWDSIENRGTKILAQKNSLQLMNELKQKNLELERNLAELRAVTLAKTQIEGELKVGKDIQMSLLPVAFPQNEFYELYAKLIPAKEVGGDFYDFFDLPDGRICFVVGDVSGKGVGAALFMAMTKTLIKSKAREGSATPAEVITSVNKEMARDNPTFMFITLFICFYDKRSGLLTFTNAGHNPPFLLRTEALLFLKDLHGPVVGIEEDYDYGFASIELKDKDKVILFTDGVPEAKDSDNKLYSDERFQALAKEIAHVGCREMVDGIVSSVEKFSEGAEQADDITVLAFYPEVKKPDENWDFFHTLQGDFDEIANLKKDMKRFLSEHGKAKEYQAKIFIGIDELLSNIVSYGKTEQAELTIDLGIKLFDDAVFLEISDNGLPFDPTSQEMPDLDLEIDDRPIGGLGVYIVNEIFSEVVYERADGRNILRLSLIETDDPR